MNETASETTASNVNDDANLEALFELYKGEGNELERAASFVTAEQLELESRARALLQEAQKTTDVSMVQSLKEQADDISSSSLRIHEFAKTYFEEKLPWYIAGGTRIVALLSDLHQVIENLETNKDGGMELWVDPSSYERYTKKYLINEGFLPHVLLFCVSQVPLLIYGQSGLITTNDTSTDLEDIWMTLATPISSVYFDSPDMKLYGRRVARQEGATLFRVRWYGDKRPTGDQVLFLELKTHHEKWIIDKSVKQRVSLCERDMATLLARDGAAWDREFVEELVLRATPTLDGDDLEEAIALLYQIRTMIVKKDLRPCVRTHYLRMAFQSNDSNARRLTIDRDVCMSDETSALPGQWCIDDMVKTRDTVKVPNAILEVKLAESDNPAFVDELLEIQAIQDAYKFSKYLTGAIKFHSDTIKTTPYWAALPLFDGLFGRNEKTDAASVVSSVPSRLKTPRASRKYSNFSVTSLRRRSSVATAQDFGKPRPVRIEPKTYFANERTYIQWVSVALLLVTIATLLLGIAIEEKLRAPRIMSIVLVFASLFIAAYAFAIYFRRLHLLKNGLPYGYIDHTGPIILTAAVLMGVIGLLYYSFNIGTTEAGTSAYTAASADPQGQCKQHAFTGISLLEYQPSDIVLDDTGTSKMLIIPSQSKITGLPLDEGEGEQEILVLGEVPGTDIEAIAYVKGILYAVSESKGDSSLMAFEPRAVGTRSFFDLVGQWKLEGRSFTEGMAYANDGKLHISEETNEVGETSHVYVYDIPTISDSSTTTIESIYPEYELNGKVLTNGIAPELTKMGSMTFFEDVLYILHDNARLVRGWDLESGKMVSKWILPRVEGGFDQQWEGMTLERVANMGKNMLRGGPSPDSSSSVMLHLALDSPPQIWSFQLNEDGEKQYTLPDCAAAF